LVRVREMGLLSADLVTRLEARWGSLLQRGREAAGGGAPKQRKGKNGGGAKTAFHPKNRNFFKPLSPEPPGARERLRTLPEPASDRQLHRYRIAVKKARYLAEDLTQAGMPEMTRTVATEKKIQDAIGRWNDLRLFRKRLRDTRDDAEKRGSVTLVRELDHLITALERTVGKAREQAEHTARRQANVATFRRGRRREAGR